MKKFLHLILAVSALFVASHLHAQTTLDLSDTWNVSVGDSTYTTVAVTSATSGTSASVTFTYTTTTTTAGGLGGIATSLGIGTLGSTVGDSITLSFTVTTDYTGGLNRAFSFGFADLSGGNEIVANVSVGTTTGSQVNLSDRPINPSGTTSEAYLFSGTNGAVVAQSSGAGTFSLSITSSDPIELTLTLVRNSDLSATLSLTGLDTATGTLYTAKTITLTEAQINALDFDTLFFGIKNSSSYTSGTTSSWTVSDLSVTEYSAVPEPSVGMLGLTTCSAGLLGQLFRRRKFLRRDFMKSSSSPSV
ncbi:MAG: hypothetical protein ACFUZC_07720 [Chthoniobacteraceae bacterium]